MNSFAVEPHGGCVPSELLAASVGTEVGGFHDNSNLERQCWRRAMGQRRQLGWRKRAGQHRRCGSAHVVLFLHGVVGYDRTRQWELQFADHRQRRYPATGRRDAVGDHHKPRRPRVPGGLRNRQRRVERRRPHHCDGRRPDLQWRCHRHNCAGHRRQRDSPTQWRVKFGEPGDLRRHWRNPRDWCRRFPHAHERIKSFRRRRQYAQA